VVAVREWTSWVAVGDSFTEGLSDEGPEGTYVGWADRLATILADRNPVFRYANLALRGKLLREIATEQVPIAIAAKPDLVTICGGGNDLIIPGRDVDALAEE
jgi:lysophospholipase L1-like esterase